MATAKYIAAGFVTDSENLLKEFVQENSTNFTIFANKWKEANFVLIFSGRDKQELQQFTHEIYQLTMDYLQNPSFILQVGAVYLLYALFRNQLSNPPVRVRIALSQWEVIKKLRVLAEKNCYIHLHYVINYLFTNAFDFVAYPILHGPCTPKGRTAIEKPSLHNYYLKDCKTDMSNFLHSNLLEEIQDLSKEYIELQAKVLPSGDKDIIDGSDLKEYINCLEKIVHDGPYCKKKIRSKSVDADLGNRRAHIKANQFERKAFFRQLNPSDSDTDYEPSSAKKEKQVKRFMKRRVPKSKRRVGRPKRFDLERLFESDGNASETTVKDKDYIKRRGPTSKTTYLDDYELHLPAKSKILKDLLSSETSSEDASDSKDTLNLKSDVSNHSEDEVDTSFNQIAMDEEDSSEEQVDTSEDQKDNSEDPKDNLEDQKDNSEDQEDNSEDQESNKDTVMSDASDESNENYELYF